MLKKLLVAGLLVSASTSAWAQSGQLAPGQVWGNAGATSAPSKPSNIAAVLTRWGIPLPGTVGGTNNAFMQFSGPALSLKTYTLANASDTIAMLGQIQTWTGAQTFNTGTLNLQGGTSGGVACFAVTGVLGASVLQTANAIILGAGVGQCPVPLGSLGTTTTVLHGNASGPPTFGAVNLSMDAGGTLQAAQEPAHTGDMTNTAGSLATTVLKTNGVAFGPGATAAAGQLPGTATNDNATAGNVGELITICTKTRASAVSLTTGTQTNICSGSLNAGDYDVFGSAGMGGTSTSVNLAAGWNTISATLPGFDSNQEYVQGQINISVFDYLAAVPTNRLSINGATTVYLVEQATFGSGTATGYGSLFARRRR